MRHRAAMGIAFAGACAALQPGAAKAQAAATPLAATTPAAPSITIAPTPTSNTNPDFPNPSKNPIPNTSPNPVTAPTPVDGINPLYNAAAPSTGGRTHPATGTQTQPAQGKPSATDLQQSRKVRDSLIKRFPSTPGVNGAAATGGIAGLKVTSQNGRTILRGTVRTQQQKADAALRAAEILGAGKNVDNQIIVQ